MLFVDCCCLISWLQVAIKLMRGCYEMYRMSPSGISADEAIFTYKYIAEPKPASHKQDNAGSGAASAKQGGISGDSVRVAHKVVTLPNDYSPRDMRAWLRPEVIESLYYLYHATHDQVCLGGSKGCVTSRAMVLLRVLSAPSATHHAHQGVFLCDNNLRWGGA
jgi:hypothetical protein